MLRNRDFARCGASCRLRREPCHRQADRKRREKQAGDNVSFSEKEAQQGARRLDKQIIL